MSRPADRTVKTMKELALQAIEVQNTCNLSGVAASFAEAILDLKYALVDMNVAGGLVGTEQINTHPIAQLWASKIHDLARMGLSDLDRYGEAYKACQELAAG